MFDKPSEAYLNGREAAALDAAVHALKNSNDLLSTVNEQRLRQMCTATLSAWLASHASPKDQADSNALHKQLAFLGEVPGRVPYYECYIDMSLSKVVKHMDLPFHLPVAQWAKEDAVKMISASMAYAGLAETVSKDGLKC